MTRRRPRTLAHDADFKSEAAAFLDAADTSQRRILVIIFHFPNYLFDRFSVGAFYRRDSFSAIFRRYLLPCHLISRRKMRLSDIQPLS